MAYNHLVGGSCEPVKLAKASHALVLNRGVWWLVARRARGWSTATPWPARGPFSSRAKAVRHAEHKGFSYANGGCALNRQIAAGKARGLK